MTYAFATTTPDVNTLAITDQDKQIIPQFVSAAHSHNVTVSISVGGWTGSRWFSTAVGSAKNRTAFVKTLSNFVNTYKFDGIDFDWEYPNHQGVGCNTISSNDTPNFLLLLQQLRSTPSTSKLILSAATSITPFVDTNGSPSASVAGFATALDFIEVMNYDIWGSWSSGVGPNAPLDDSCAAPANQQGSAVSAVAKWTAAGMPVDKIVLGVAGYGHSFSVAPTNAIKNGTLAAYPEFNAGNQPTGDAWDDPAGPDVCGVQQRVGGNFDYWGLVAAGYLDQQGNPGKDSNGNNVDFRFDNCSQTAYLYDTAHSIEISFDNVQAFAAKGQFIKTENLRGFSMWEAGSDYNNTLLDAILDGVDPQDEWDYCD